MVLHVLSNNEGALEFYKKNGFEVKEFLKDHYTDLDPSDAYYLELNMPQESEDAKK